jgi:hypothetical protein
MEGSMFGRSSIIPPFQPPFRHPGGNDGMIVFAETACVACGKNLNNQRHAVSILFCCKDSL